MKKLAKSNHALTAGVATLLTLAVALPVKAAPASDYTHYVTDSVEIPLRSKPGYKYKILRMLKSGTVVTITEVNEEGWAKLIYRYKGNDIEGWMPSSVLQSQPIAKFRLESQIKKTANIEKQYNQVQLEKETLQNRFQETSLELKETKKENFELNKKLENLQAISGDAINLYDQNQNMKQEIERLNNENAIMKEQIDQSEDVVQRQWFLTGGGVLLLGLLLGRFFRIPSRKNKWNSL